MHVRTYGGCCLTCWCHLAHLPHGLRRLVELRLHHLVRRALVGQRQVEKELLHAREDGAALQVQLARSGQPLEVLVGEADHGRHLLLRHSRLVLLDVVDQRDHHAQRLLAGRQLNVRPGGETAPQARCFKRS